MEGGNAATSSAGRFGSAPPRSQDGSQGATNEPPPVALAKQNPTKQTPRAVEDSNKFNKEKFRKNGPKESVGAVDPVKVQNQINNIGNYLQSHTSTSQA